MIYITGDIHANIDIGKLSNQNFPEGKTLTRQDYVIICGDFGLPFLPSDTWPEEEFIPNKYDRHGRKNYQYWIKWLSERPYTVLWLDGNHDNHPFWQEQETAEWNGGLVNIHPDADNVIHLKRGEYYEICGHTFWVMGGAQLLLAPVLDRDYEPESTRTYFDQVYQRTEFQYWYCGHFHEEIDSPECRIRVIYNDVVRLAQLKQSFHF